MPSQSKRRSNGALAERVKSILASRNLTLYQVSERSAALFGRSSPHYLPHNLYYDLREGALSPSLFQLFAFSRISGYRLTDWLRVFGFAVEVIPRLQGELPSMRTTLLDSSTDDPEAFIPWLRNLGTGPSPAGVVPLSQVLGWTGSRRLTSLALGKESFLYAKIGHEDALAFPELLPGSIVRVRRMGMEDLLHRARGEQSKELMLLEHAKGFCCCHIRVVGAGRIVMIATQMPYAQVELKVPQEARLVGVVDLEIRSLLKPQQPAVAKGLGKRWRPEVVSSTPPQLGPLLRRARQRMGLSFRAASAVSREVAKLLDDERYFTAPGSLSDYETLNVPPRHFHKIVTFCAAYSLDLQTVLETMGLNLQNAGQEPIPYLLTDRPLSGMVETAAEADGVEQTGFLGELISEFGEVPFFLRRSLPALSGLQRPSLKDFFWIGRTGSAFHPYLAGGLVAVVNRQKKRPNDCGSKPLWQQPLYVILKRDGTYLCGCCSRENSSLVVHSYPGEVHRREQFRNRDADVIGKIVAVVRKL